MWNDSWLISHWGIWLCSHKSTDRQHHFDLTHLYAAIKSYTHPSKEQMACSMTKPYIIIYVVSTLVASFTWMHWPAKMSNHHRCIPGSTWHKYEKFFMNHVLWSVSSCREKKMFSVWICVSVGEQESLRGHSVATCKWLVLCWIWTTTLRNYIILYYISKKAFKKLLKVFLNQTTSMFHADLQNKSTHLLLLSCDKLGIHKKKCHVHVS